MLTRNLAKQNFVNNYTYSGKRAGLQTCITIREIAILKQEQKKGSQFSENSELTIEYFAMQSLQIATNFENDANSIVNRISNVDFYFIIPPHRLTWQITRKTKCIKRCTQTNKK